MKLQLKHLKFDNPFLEREFTEDYYHKSLMTVRIALILGVILYSIFGILDLLIAPISKNKILFIRFAIVCPGLIAVFILTWFQIFKKYMQQILMLITIIAGLGIVAIIGITVEETTSLYYYAGLILVLMWAYTLIKLRFIYAAIACWSIILSYEATVIVFHNMLSDQQQLYRFINNNFFFISSNIIGMFAGYLIELYTRKDFLQRREIAEKSEELRLERNELEYLVTTMNEELDMACLIQKKLIPSGAPADNIYSLYKPMKAIGGDFMDFIRLSDQNKIGIFISDVSGHGVPAALITSIIKSSIHESKKYYYDPSMMLIHLNEVLSSLTEDIFVTAFYGIYDPAMRSIVYSNAGHHPPSVITSEGTTTLDSARGLPLAVMKNIGLIESDYLYTNSDASLPAGSKLLFYTDGVPETRSLKDQKKNFASELAAQMIILKDLNCRNFTEKLFYELKEFRGSDSFEDDICIICVDIK